MSFLLSSAGRGTGPGGNQCGIKIQAPSVCGSLAVSQFVMAILINGKEKEQ